MKMIKFPSIEQMNSTIKNLTMHFQYVGKDEDGKGIFDSSKVLPTVWFTGTTKLHGCFEKNTLITLANGEQIPISEITAGDYVLSYDTKIDAQVIKPVINVFKRNLDKEWCKVIFDSGEIICTKDHKFFTKNRGYVEAQHLDCKDIFLTSY